MSTARAHLIINAHSGSAGHHDVAERARQVFASHGIDATWNLVHSPQQLHRAAARAAAGEHDIVVAGGGDGTIAAVAHTLADTGKTLGVLPLGTFNYFARRFDIPTDVDGALEVIAAGHEQTVSIGDVNGRTFLNNASIGLYPALLRSRERVYGRVGRSQLAAYASAAVALARRPATLTLQMTLDDAPVSRETPLLFVAANPAQLEAFGLDGHACVETGRLALLVTQPVTTARLWKLALGGWLKGFGNAQELEAICTAETVVTLRKQRVRVAVDGEIVRLRTPLRFRLRRDALRVLAAQEA
jgi:diacylglycerol kinase family enzyme